MSKEQIIKLCYKDEVLYFSVYKDDSFSEDEVADIVEDAVIQAKSDSDWNLKSIGDIVYYGLSEAGYIVRDFPYDAKIHTFDVEAIRISDIERG